MAGNGGEKQFKNYRQSLMTQAFGVQIKDTSENPLRAIKNRAKKQAK